MCQWYCLIRVSQHFFLWQSFCLVLHRESWTLRGGVQRRCCHVGFRALSLLLSAHFISLGLMIITNYFKKKLLPWGLNDALIYGHRNMSLWVTFCHIPDTIGLLYVYESIYLWIYRDCGSMWKICKSRPNTRKPTKKTTLQN